MTSNSADFNFGYTYGYMVCYYERTECDIDDFINQLSQLSIKKINLEQLATILQIIADDLPEIISNKFILIYLDGKDYYVSLNEKNNIIVGEIEPEIEPDLIIEFVDRFINENAEKFLKYYYYNHITNCKERENYFRKYGGDKWLDKFHSCKDYRYYDECINGNMFKDELSILIKESKKDLIEIIKNDEINGVYKVEEYSDIYYTYEQFEYIYRHHILN